MRAKPDEKRGLDKVLRFSVLGAVIIVFVYSIYYYSNAYRLMSSKLIETHGEDNVHQILMDTSDHFSGEKSAFYSPIFNCVFKQSGNYQFSNMPKFRNQPCFEDAVFSNCFALVNGAKTDGVVDEMFDVITERFGTAPPPEMQEKDQDFVFYGVHYQNFMLSANYLVNWLNPDTLAYPYKRHAFVVLDSVKQTCRLAGHDQKIMRIERPGHSDHCYLAEWRPEWAKYSIAQLNQKVLPNLVFGHEIKDQAVVRFPLMDFQWNHIFNVEGANAKSEETGVNHKVTYAGIEAKALLGPNLKMPNSYEVDLSNQVFIDFKPPMLVIMSKDNSTIPYLAVLIKDNALLID